MKENKIKILLVDDDPELSWILTETISDAGYRVFSAEDGKTAIEVLKNDHPDLILLDIGMPDIQGHLERRKSIKNLDKVFGVYQGVGSGKQVFQAEA